MTARYALLPLAALALSGCDLLTEVAKSTDVSAPEASLNRVEQTDGPTNEQSLSWICYEFLSDTTCQLAGWDSQPSDAAMRLSFDLVFDLNNPNDTIPIPLVEILLGINVIDNTNLGSVCISFCDPDDATCEPGVNVEGACEVDDETVDVKEPQDLIPTVDDLVGLAEAIAEGEVDNSDFRVIPPGETMEGHVQFNLEIGTTYRLMENVVNDAIDDFIARRAVQVDIPYTVDGSLFFDVPELGRYAVGFGPFSDSWPVLNVN